jgi:indole-3-glycerol phosphate synthase
MTSGDFLATMAASSAERAAAAQARESSAELRARIRDLPSPPPLRLSSRGFDLIAELKLRSPALGQLRAAAHDDLEARVLAYAGAGAAAVSVLTEPSRFDGSLQHLERAAKTLAAEGVPAMRKDFLVDPHQVLEARLAGAGGVLLIVRMLSPAVLAQMIETALEQQLFILLETFDEQEVDTAVAVLEPYRQALGDSVLLGVNCRDLVTLNVVPERLESMVNALPEHLPRVAESGLSSAADAARLAAAGYDLALVGSALMTGSDPQALGKHMLDAGREARGHSRRWARGQADAMAR